MTEEKPTIKTLLLSGVDEKKDEYVVLIHNEEGGASRGYDNRNSEYITSFPALRLELPQEDQRCRVAFPTDELFEYLENNAVVDKNNGEPRIITKLEFSKKKRKGSYWVDKVLPIPKDWKKELKSRIEAPEE